MNKAKILENLNLKNSVIPKLKIYSVEKFLKNKNLIIEDIVNFFKNKDIAIRSSHIEEDGQKFSNAGKYSSFLNVKSKNKKEVEKKIILVIKSYKKNIKNNIFFIQEMVKNIKISGVILTKDINNYSDCYVLNFYKGSDSTIVTSGKKDTETIRFFKNEKYLLKNPFNKLIKSIYEIEKKFNFPLDVEFIINKKNIIHVVQIRKLVTPPNKNIVNKNINKMFKNLEKKITKLQQPHYSLYGNKNFFGVMPDWNPAEIIGKKPRPLALSLYQELITNHTWSESRREYGYENLNDFQLMNTFFGTPYIDIRIDFNSWLPENLPKILKKKLTNFYLKKFEKNSSSHDKIEKDIIFTAFNFISEERIKKELKNILNRKEIKQLISGLKNINKLALQKCEIDLSKVNELKKKQKQIEKSNLYFIDKIYWHVEECKNLGTLPFAGLARCGFIAIDLLNSLVQKNIFSTKDKLEFMESLSTVSSKIISDFKLLNKKKFINKYGHLRPNTYDITSKNYEENYKEYFGKGFKNYQKNKNFNLNSIQKKKISKLIKKSKIYRSPEQLLSFIKTSIENREYAKFVFSKSIDLIFKNMRIFGKKHKLKIDDLSYLEIDDLLSSYFNLSSEKLTVSLKKKFQLNKKEYSKNLKIILPDTIFKPEDIYIQNIGSSVPNYITEKKVTSKFVIFSKKINYKKLKNNIICIENADPGYDFLFSHNIKGLITKYGGYNSHMAIRCSELDIPAVIGLGEKKFSMLKNANFVEIDCKNKKLNF